MSQVLQRWPSLQHFKDGDYSKFLELVDTDILIAEPGDKCTLVYYKACAFKRLGFARKAADSYREVAESDASEKAYVASSLFNLGLWALECRDLEYSENCLAMYKSCPASIISTSRVWELTITTLRKKDQSLGLLLKQLLIQQPSDDVINLVCIALELTEKQELLLEFLEAETNEVTRSSRFYSVAFICDIKSKNYGRAKRSLEFYRASCTTKFMEIKLEYFDLMLLSTSENGSQRLTRAASSLLKRVSEHPRFSGGEIQQFCSRILFENNGIKRVLVSRRHGMIGESPQLEQIREMIDLYANSDLNILIRGDSGTGKELVAIALHQNSRRRDQGFVPVNCFHLGTQLAEARLFGHRKGAFTGATQDSPGFVHEAHGGTLFLDEVGELPIEAQANLFRFLDSGQFRRVGSTELENANVRVIAATNQDLSKDSHFRHELYHRLGTVIIDLPPLAERGNDVLHIARCRVAELNVLGGITKQLSAEAEKKLLAHDWPGNVRELLNVIDRAWHASSQEIAGDVLRFDRGVPLHMVASLGWAPDLQPDVVDLDESVNRYTARLVHEMLERCNRDTAEAARRLNISERTVYRWMKRNDQFTGNGKDADTSDSPQ